MKIIRNCNAKSGIDGVMRFCPAHVIGANGGESQLFNKPVVDDCADRRPDEGDQLGHLCQIDIVAVFLLKAAPVELVNVFW